MKKNRTIYFLWQAIFLFVCGVYSYGLSQPQPETGNFFRNYISRSWTASDGIPGNSVTDILIDNHGFIVFGTYGGVVRFDGIEFETFSRITSSYLDYLSARALFLDSQNNFWIGSNDEGLTRIASDGMTVKNFSVETGLPNNSIRDICEDTEGNIWVGTSAGVVYITPEDTIVKPEGLAGYDDDQAMVVRLSCDSSGRIWLVSAKVNGIYYYVGSRFTRYTGITSIPNPLVTIVFEDTSGALWFGVAPYYIVKVDGEKETVFDLRTEDQSALFVNTVFQDKDNNMWLGLDRGCAVIQNGILQKEYINYRLTDDSVNEIIQDKEGSIWFATDRGGLEKLSYSKFQTITLPTTVNAIAEDPTTGFIWMATDNGLYCFDGPQKIENEATRYCENVRIRDVSFTPEGDMLVSSYAKLGQLKISPEGVITSWKQEDGLTGEKVRVALEAKNGDLYIGTTNGLNVVSKTTGKIKTYTRTDGLPNDYIMCLYEDESGRLWCGTDGGGVFVLKNGVIEKLYTTKDGLAGNVVFKIATFKEDKNALWFSTGTGLSRLKDGEFFTYTSSKGLGTDDVFQMVLDFQGTAWLTSNAGISSTKFSDFLALAEGGISTVSSKFFTQDDGLISGGPTATSRSMVDSKGRIWFTLIDGFAVYNPSTSQSNTVVPSAKIKTVDLDSEVRNYSSIKDGKLIVPADVKRVSVHYTGLSFISPEQLQFSHKLQGFDSDFSDWTFDRIVSYTNLKPGTYTLFLKTKNGDDIESDVFQGLVLIKEPFYWQTVSFWLMVILCAGGCLGGIVYLITRSKYAHRLEIAKGKTDSLLLHIFPEHVARILSNNPNACVAERHENVSILFADIVDFTRFASAFSPNRVVEILNTLFTKFDERAKKEHIEKIKTIGDAYMAAIFNADNDPDAAKRCIHYARGMLQDLETFNKEEGTHFSMRIGINTGSVVAGVIGKTKFIYDIWGDSVNVASRMESTGIAGKIHVSERIYLLTKDSFSYSEPVTVEVKGKGLMKTYFLE